MRHEALVSHLSLTVLIPAGLVTAQKSESSWRISSEGIRTGFKIAAQDPGIRRAAVSSC